MVFDYSRYEVISFLNSSAVFWAEKYHIDGLRLDNVAAMLYLDYNKAGKESAKNQFGGKENLEAVSFIQKLNIGIHERFPNIMTFAEESTAWPMISKPAEQGGLGFDFKWNMGWMNDMLHYMSLDPFYRPFNHTNMIFSFFYAFAESFVLPISHDVVVYGKKSLLSKMPGDFDSRFDQVRVFMAYMMMHPGKKLTFMGAEIGQMEEWNTDSELSWEVLELPKNSQLQYFIKCLNKFYVDNPPMYEIEESWDGFLFFQVLGKLLADGFLKISRLRIIDGKDGREAELADDFVDRGIVKVGSGAVGKQHKKCSFANFNYLPIVAPALPKVNQR